MEEEILDPELPICDAHHHLWDGPGERSRYLLDQFLADTIGGHNIVKTVFVECGTMYRKDGPEEMRPIGETEFAQGIAAQSASGQYGITSVAAGIIGYVDLTLGSHVVPVIEAHLAASKKRFRGVRQSCTWDNNSNIISLAKAKGMMLEPKFREGFSYLKKYNLSYDSWQYYTQLTELVDLARAFPDINIIVDHTGGILGVEQYTGKNEEIFREWKCGMTELASCPNVVVKLGGLGMPRCGFSWHLLNKLPNSIELAAAMAPYFLLCIEIFGAGRCMFESNFPVDKVSYSYTVIWNTFKRISRNCSPSERAALFHDTAVRIYRLAVNNET